VVIVGTPAVAICTLVLVAYLLKTADNSRQAQITMAQVQVYAQKIDALEWQVMAERRVAPGTLAELQNAKAELRAAVSRLPSRTRPGRIFQEFMAALASYLTSVDQELLLAEAGRFEEARKFDSEEVDPHFDVLQQKIKELSAEYGQRVESVVYRSVTGATIGVVLATSIILVLFQRFERAKHRTKEALEEVRRQHELILTKDALKQSEAKFKTLFEAANDAILIVHGERFSDCNLRAETLFRCGKEDIVGHSPLDFSPSAQPDGRLSSEKAAEKIQAALRGLPQFFEWKHVRHDGTFFDVEVSLNRVITPEAEYLQAIVRDVTERKRAGGELQQANKKLSIAVSAMERRASESTHLSEMGGLLQSCQNPAEAYKVVAWAAEQLFPSVSGALCVTSPSRNMVEAVVAWGAFTPMESVFVPEDCWALRRGRPHYTENAASSLRCRHLGDAPSQASICIPMLAQGEALGILHLRGGAAKPDEPLPGREQFSGDEQRLAEAVAEHVALALANLSLRERLRSQSIRDPLTGLFNRRYLEESLDRELCGAARKQRPLAVIMLDLDHFKRFNDTFGHEAGDVVLREVGKLLQRNLRGEDIACRYGGEEFVLILVEAPIEAARQRAEQIRADVKQLIVEHAGQTFGAVTLSLGIAAFPEDGQTSNGLVNAADQALYRAKAAGRDRVVVGPTGS